MAVTATTSLYSTTTMTAVDSTLDHPLRVELEVVDRAPPRPAAAKPQNPRMPTRAPHLGFASALVAVNALIIANVPYWDAYMSQVDGFLVGERDYTKAEGGYWPLVYLAGFLYVYSAIKFVTGGEVYPVQFGVAVVMIKPSCK